MNLVARHAAMPLLDALLAWRKDAESQAQRSGVELVILRKKVHSACLYGLVVAVCSSSTCPAQHEWMDELHHISDRLCVNVLIPVIQLTVNAWTLQLAVETVFLEASHQLVGPESSGLSGRQAEALERLAFDWALNAETYVEPKFSDLIKAREKVCNLDLG